MTIRGRWALSFFVLIGQSNYVFAQAQPAYEAEIAGRNAFAVSGPGVGYYPTQALPTGDKVTVFGPRVGDWLAILPPKGSFSWLPQDTVVEQEDGSGVIATDGVKLRVGSALSEGHHVFQVTLNRGDKVKILDLVPLKHDGKIANWYKVVPHRDELRYVLAEHVKTPQTSGPTVAKIDSSTKTPAAPTSADTGAAPLTTAQTNPAVDANPFRQVGTRVLPPAKPLERGGVNRAARSDANANQPNQPPTELVDRPDLPFDRRIRSIQEQVDWMKAREPSSWNVDKAKEIAANLKSAARTEGEKAVAVDLAVQIAKLSDVKERYERAVRRRDMTLDRDMELAGQQNRKFQEAGRLARRYVAEGTMGRSATTVDDRPAFKIVDAAGRTTHQLTAPPGINLDRWVGERVGILGTVTTRPNSPVPVIEVSQIQALNPEEPQ